MAHIKKSTTELLDLEQVCPILYALDIIGQKWKIPIMWHLAEDGTLRYNQMKRAVRGITNIMLTKSLQELEVYQLVCRKQYDTVPPKVEYSLTERGLTLLPVLKSLDIWGKEQIEYARMCK
ncbi:winged helix-turn-helix transcriptional regulator [Sulfurospirillum arsenophilum]|uniref:winged helix-turn-helix transcriptional regulator n=1 Tax=Sulfurospirillum arsenophilum TaxID=56698 RepID=UPI0005AA3DAB|nr:helix-turn-helix domain-containing protein [Sulfurospirillum arsenophilum]